MAGHPGYVNYMIIHRLTVNKNKNAILLYGKIGELTNYIPRLVANKIFDHAEYAFDTMGQLAESTQKVQDMIIDYLILTYAEF